MTDIDSLKKELDLAFPTKTPQQEKVFAEMDVESKKQEYANKLKMPSAPSSGGFLDTTKIKSEPGLKLETPNFNVDEIFSKTNSGEYIAKFDTYTPGIDNYDKFSREQTTGDKWLNGATQFTQTVVNSIAGLGNLVYGTGAMIKEGELSSFYDNDYMNWLDDVSEKRRLNNPIYKTYEEQEMGFGESLGTHSFWADDFLQGASFTAGMVASELVLRGLTGGVVGGVGLSRAGLSATTQGASKLNTLKNAMGLARTAAVKPITTAMSNVLPKLSGVTIGSNVGKLANIVRTGVTSAGYEAGFEARHFMREMRANFEEDFIEANGVPPTEEDRAEFESALKSKANGLFAFNVAVVGASNIAQFGSALGIKLPKIKGLSSNPDSWINRKVFGVGVSDGAIATATRGNKLARVGYTFGKNAFLEGFEEGLQGVGSKTAEKMLKDSYSLNNANQTMGYANSFIQSMSEQYGTEEGLKEVYLGMLIGAMTGSAANLLTARTLADGNFKVLDQRAKGIEKQLLKGGSYSADNMMQKLLSANRTVANKRDEQKAIQEGDISGVQTARHSEMFNQTLRGIELNYLDQIKEQTLQQLDMLSNEEIATMADVEVSEASRIREELKQEYKNETKVIEDMVDASKRLVAGSINKGEYNFAVEGFVKRGYSQEEAKAQTANKLQSALAYEMYIGKVSYEQADNFLNTFLNEVQDTIGSPQVRDSFNINDILNTSEKQVRQDFYKTKGELQQTVSELEQLEKDYRRVENVISQTTAETGNRQQLVGQLNDLVTKREELNKRKQELEANANALLSSSVLRTPIGAKKKKEFTAEELLTFEENIVKTLEDLRKVSPEKAERLGGMLYEYQKSVNAYKTLDKRVKQLTDPNVGLRTKKGLLPSLFGRKTPNEQTAEMIRGLINTHYQLGRNTQEGVEKVVAKVVQEQLVEVGVDKREILDYLKDQPYLFEQYNESTENIIPTEAEIEEYYDFAQRNIAGEEPLTDEEKARFEELNTKLANWYLTESTPLADVLKQQALRETKVEETVEEDLTDEDVDGMLEKDKKAGRPFNFLQTVQDVYLQFYKDSNTYYFSHLSPRGFLEFIGATTDLKVQRKDSKKVEPFSLDDELKTGDRVFFGNNMSFTLEDGARIKIVTSKENFNSFGFKTRMTASGYSVVYDGDKVMKSDYADIDTYSPQEIMSLSNGDEIFAFIDMEDGYNQSLTEEEFENNVKISFRDAQGNKIADLKALHLSEAEDTSEIPVKFLEARAKAKELAWGKTGSIELGNATVETVFLGAPNVVLENGVEKWQPVDENLIEDSGMWDGGKLTTKNGTKGVRTDLLKEIKKKVPVIIVKVGNTLIAYPVRGGKVASNMAETFTEKGAKLALKINETLIQNGKKPAQIYYNSETDQNMYSEDGTPTQELQDALDRVNSITTESTNITEAEINIDLNGVPFLAPKMAINLDSFQTVNIQPVVNQPAQKPKSRLNLQDDYFTLDFKPFAYFTDENGDIYTKEVGEIARAKTMSNMVKTLPKAEQERVKQAWAKQPVDYFENENFEKVVPNVGTSSRTKQGKKNKDKEC